MNSIVHMWVGIDDDRTLYSLHFKGVLVGFQSAENELKARQIFCSKNNFNWPEIKATARLFN